MPYPSPHPLAPDVVLPDVMMPVKNGYEMCHHIDSVPWLRRIQVILLCARSREVGVVKGTEAEVDACVTKPFSTRDLAAKVRDVPGE
jgi:DNA-binding response OmpR family regulator